MLLRGESLSTNMSIQLNMSSYNTIKKIGKCLFANLVYITTTLQLWCDIFYDVALGGINGKWQDRGIMVWLLNLCKTYEGGSRLVFENQRRNLWVLRAWLQGKSKNLCCAQRPLGGVEGDDDEKLCEGKPKVFGCFAVHRRSCVWGKTKRFWVFRSSLR